MADLAPDALPLLEGRLMPLGPGTPNAVAFERLRTLTPLTLFAPAKVTDIDGAKACLAGLWLLHDFLHESHSLSQDLSTPEGSWWHAIMHRREPDPWNSKYWFRRVGKHPVAAQLVEQAPAFGYPFTNSLDFVDFSDRLRDTGSQDEDLAKRVQHLEWQLLFAHCCKLATS